MPGAHVLGRVLLHKEHGLVTADLNCRHGWRPVTGTVKERLQLVCAVIVERGFG